MDELSIGQLAVETSCNVETIRYYEKIGLLAVPPRTRGGQRRYAATYVGRLRFIRHARNLGFDISDIRQLLAFSDRPDQDCQSVDEIARHHVDEISRKIEKLTDLRSELQRMIRSCRRGRVADCRILQALGHAS